MLATSVDDGVYFEAKSLDEFKRLISGDIPMAGNARNVVFGSMGVAGLMALASILDMVLGIPFQGQMVLDIMFILAAGIVIYMGIDCLKDQR